MKKTIFSILGLCGAMLLGGCEDRLDIPQKGVVTTEEFFADEANAQNSLNNLYQCMAMHIMSHDGKGIYAALPVLFNEPGDDMLAAGNFYGDNDFAAQINEFRYDIQNPVIDGAYKSLYCVVYDANTIIDNIVPDTPTKKRVVAEARTFRAWAHMMLAIGWDCPPLVDHILASNAQPSNYEGGHKALLEWCAKEAEECVADLDERESPADQVGASKATKGLALTIAGKARLFMGDYDGAKKDLKQVIDSKKYELVPGNRWADLFHITGDLCEEMIFQINILDNPSVDMWDKVHRSTWMFIQFWNWRTDKLPSMPSFIGAGGWGGHAIRPDFAEKMLANDGDSPRRKATFMTGDEFLYEMDWDGVNGKKIDSSVSRAERETDPGIGIKDQTGLYGFGGYFATKVLPSKADTEGTVSYTLRNYTLFRYAEVLLMYAEACAQTGDNDGLQYLNAIQTRAGARHISSTLTLDEVKNEKAYEMWLEGVRFPDMVRWGDTDGIVNNGKDIPSTYDAFFTKGEPKHRLYVEYSNPNKGTVGFVKGKHEYFCYPYKSISQNPNLKQNPSGL